MYGIHYIYITLKLYNATRIISVDVKIRKIYLSLKSLLKSDRPKAKKVNDFWFMD